MKEAEQRAGSDAFNPIDYMNWILQLHTFCNLPKARLCIQNDSHGKYQLYFEYNNPAGERDGVTGCEKEGSKYYPQTNEESKLQSFFTENINTSFYTKHKSNYFLIIREKLFCSIP